MDRHTAARGLGWLSLCVGLAEVAATKSVGKMVRMQEKHGLLRSFGVREMATGVGLLSGRRRASWIWARVAGDVMDLVALGSALAKSKKHHRKRLAASLAAVAGVTALDVMCGRRMSKAQ
jgi:hypothetical protein